MSAVIWGCWHTYILIMSHEKEFQTRVFILSLIKHAWLLTKASSAESLSEPVQSHHLKRIDRSKNSGLSHPRQEKRKKDFTYVVRFHHLSIPTYTIMEAAAMQDSQNIHPSIWGSRTLQHVVRGFIAISSHTHCEMSRPAYGMLSNTSWFWLLISHLGPYSYVKASWMFFKHASDCNPDGSKYIVCVHVQHVRVRLCALADSLQPKLKSNVIELMKAISVYPHHVLIMCTRITNSIFHYNLSTIT